MTQRLTADADTALWVPVTDSLGFRGRRQRKAAIRMLTAQANQALGVEQRGGGRFATWAMSQAVPLLMRQANGRVLVWVRKDEPELAVVMASIQQATPQARTARATRPIEYDDTETFRSPFLGVGEKLRMDEPGRKPPFVSWTWDMATHFVEITAVSGDLERFGTIIGQLDDLARTVRVVDDLPAGESSDVLRLPSA